VRLLMGLCSVTALVVVWQVAADSGLMDIRFSSSPSRIAASAREMLASLEFWRNAGSSCAKFTWGMVLACAAGIPFGILMGWNTRVRLIFEPVVMVFYSVPSTTFMPLIILWFGIGLNSYAVLVFMGAFFPILVNSMAGVRQVQESLVRAARSFGANEFEIFWHVLIPSALPFVMGGIRLGLGRGLMAVVLGEMYFSIAGIGHLIMRYQAGLNIDRLMFLVVVTAFFGVALIAVARRVEARLGPWRQAREVE
jgi:ABC-type nitrate/sulfonate/bicarbonate transport system permease component